MSILSGAGRTYGFDLDIIKSPSPSSGRSTTSSSSSSSPSSTISESSNSPRAISAKGARAPRKRPNQSYSEAAALLSTIYPNLFSTKNLHKLTKPFSSLSPSSLSSSDLLLLLPPSPGSNEAGFLIQDSCPNQQPSPLRFEFRPASPSQKSCIEYQEPGSPDSPDYDVESILDEEAGEGIDSIMGHLSMENCVSNSNSSYVISPYLGSLMGFGIGGKAELGFGHALGRNNIRQALRGAHDGDWWRPTTTVPVGDIVPKFNALPPLEKKKKSKKKKNKVEEAVKDEPKVVAAATTRTTKAQVPAEAATATTTPATTTTTTTTCSLDVELKSGLGLKLNHEDVLRAWSDRDFPFTNGSGTPESSADILARLSDIDLIPDSEAGVRGASVQRYREKRRTRLFSKKIRYQVRKVNADCRPRMKGRFVKRPDLLQEAIDEESQ